MVSPFDTPIKSKYVKTHEHTKTSVFIKYIDIFDFNVFMKTLNDKKYLIKDNNRKYSVFIKVRFRDDEYRMAGSQFQQNFKSIDDFVNLQNTIIERLDETFNKYDIKINEVVHVILNIIPFKFELLKDFGLDKDMKEKLDLLNIYKDKTSLEKINNIPVTTNYADTLDRIDVKIKDGICVHIPFNYKGVEYNLVDLINEQNKLLSTRKRNDKDVVEFDSGWVFYFIEGYRTPYILAHKKYDDGSIRKLRYHWNGVILDDVKDVLSNDVLVRYNKNHEYTIKNQSIVEHKYNMNLIPIKRKVTINSNITESPYVGVIDFETIECYDGIHRVFCLGFKTLLTKDPVTYFVDLSEYKTGNYNVFDDLMINMINELLDPKYKGIIFYMHNLGGFDVVYLISVLLRHNENKDNGYRLDYVFRNKNILKLTISKDITISNNVKGVVKERTVTRKLTICDSLAILTNSIQELGNALEVETLKLKFPY